MRRELLWLCRYGEFGPDSERHLDHLARCADCRDEVGYDREMVRQLRIALRERVDGLDPSSKAWEGIVRRARAPEPGRWSGFLRRVGGLATYMRTTTAMAGTGLALLLALNMEVIPVSVPATTTPTPAPRVTSLEQVPRVPTGRTALVAFRRQSAERTVPERTDLEKLMTHFEARIPSPQPGAPAMPVEEPPADEEDEAAEESRATEVRFIVRPVRALEVPRSGAPPDRSSEAVRFQAGEPS